MGFYGPVDLEANPAAIDHRVIEVWQAATRLNACVFPTTLRCVTSLETGVARFPSSPLWPRCVYGICPVVSGCIM